MTRKFSVAARSEPQPCSRWGFRHVQHHRHAEFLAGVPDLLGLEDPPDVSTSG